MLKVVVGCCMVVVVLSMTCYLVYAADPPPVQDFCVALNDYRLPVHVNGQLCKNPEKVTSNDFRFRGFTTPGNTSNPYGSDARMINVFEFPALNTMGVAMGRVYFAPYGVNPPHFHPRASEMFAVMKGTVLAGFITSNQPDGTNRLYSAVLKEGDIFLFPQGMIHFQISMGKTPAYAVNAFGGQNPGRVDIDMAVFGSTPLVPFEVLTRGFLVNKTIIKALVLAQYKY